MYAKPAPDSEDEINQLNSLHDPRLHLCPSGKGNLDIARRREIN